MGFCLPFSLTYNPPPRSAAGSQLPSRTASTPLRRRLRFAPDAATATVAMDPVKLDGIRKKRRAELLAQLEEIKSELKKLKEERSLPGAKVTDGAPNKLSEMEKLHPFLVEVAKKHRAELREAYSNRKPLILNLRGPCCTAASPPGVVKLPGLQNDVDRESMVEGAITLQRAALQAHPMDRNIGNARITGDGEDEDADVTVD